jgi:hypothetical protein
MNENLKFLGDHVPGLNVVGIDVQELPSTAVQGTCVLHTETGEYSVYSVRANNIGSAWTRYPASKGLMAYFDDAVYGNTGLIWKEVVSSGTGGTDSQTLAILDHTLAITGGNAITLPDNQTLSLSGNTLAISGGNSVTLPSGGTGGTDSQTLVISDHTLAISGGNSVTLPDNQTLAISGTTLAISGGNSVTLPSGSSQFFQSGTNTTLSGAGTALSKYQYDVATATTTALGVARFATAPEALAGTANVISTPSTVNTQLEARYTQSNIAVGFATSEKLLITNPTVRTYANATISDTVLNPSAGWGTWQNSSVFGFSQAGAYRFDIHGLLFAEISNASTMKRTNITAYLVIGSIAYWLGGAINQLIEIGSVFPSSGISGSITSYNVSAGDLAYIVIVSAANPGFTTLNIYWGITGATQSGGNSASGLIITKV